MGLKNAGLPFVLFSRSLRPLDRWIAGNLGLFFIVQCSIHYSSTSLGRLGLSFHARVLKTWTYIRDRAAPIRPPPPTFLFSFFCSPSAPAAFSGQYISSDNRRRKLTASHGLPRNREKQREREREREREKRERELDKKSAWRLTTLLCLVATIAVRRSVNNRMVYLADSGAVFFFLLTLIEDETRLC